MDYEKLMDTLKYYHKTTNDNIIGVTYGLKKINDQLTDTPSIVFTVREKKSEKELTEDEILPKNINIDNDIIPTDVIQGKYKLLTITDCDPNFYTWRTIPPTNRDEQRPLECGVSCTNWDNAGLKYDDNVGQWLQMKDYVGTMGLLAIDNENGSLVGVTNNHVVIYDAFICSQRTNPTINASTVNNVKGDDVTQPNEYPETGLIYSIGKVKRYYPLIEGYFNEIDTALFTIDDPNDINNSTSFHQHNLTPSTYPWASTAEINSLIVGDTKLFYSSGRTTGAKGEGATKLRFYGFTSFGPINYARQGVDVGLSFMNCMTFIATLTDSGPYTDTCYDPISGGDSGSALIADFGGTKKVIGLVFAGMSDNTEKTTIAIACRIDRIAELLNISAWNGEPVAYSDYNNVMEMTVPGLSGDRYIDYNGNRYWQVGLRLQIT